MEKTYFCIVCQKPSTMATIRMGGHRGHFLTEFETTQHESPSDNSLMRMFRETCEAAKRYKERWVKGIRR